MKIKLAWVHAYYIDCPLDMEDFKCEKFNSDNADDGWHMRSKYRDSKDKANFYNGENEEFKEWLLKIKEN